jgi:methionyl-tRNA synthetase
MPVLAGKLLVLLLPPGNAQLRVFATLGPAGRLVPGTAIPEPQGVFPRYVDPEEAAKTSAALPKPKKPKGEKPQT